MRIVLTGATGYLGRSLAARLTPEHEVVATSRSGSALVPGCRPARAELEDPESLAALIARESPRLVIHAAAWANPDLCEKEPARARAVNALATGAAAAAARKAGARFLYTSTDLVFDGKAPPYRESDPPSPLGAYALGKEEGERLALAAHPDALVVRVSLIYGWNLGERRVFTEELYRALAAGKPVNVFSDQRRAMILAEDAAELIARVAELPDGGFPRGPLHLAGPEPVSRLRFAELFCDALGFDRALLRPVELARSGLAAFRPLDCSLDGSRAFALLGWRPRTVAEGVQVLAASRPKLT